MSDERSHGHGSPPTTHHSPLTTHHSLIYHFCRLQLPAVVLPVEIFERNLQRTFDLFRRKSDSTASWATYLDNLYAVDWYLAVACLEGNSRAWEQLFAARAYRTDCLLIDALRSRAARLYPGNEEHQESAVTEFWSQLLVPESPTSLPVLARYDGQRPLVPWLIRVFQNLHISQLRHRSHERPLPEDDLSEPLPAENNGAWHEEFCAAAREWVGQLKDSELLILGLRLRFRMSQREAANLLGIHEGNVSRQTSQLRDRCLAFISQKLVEQGWTGDDLSQYVLSEMAGVLLNEPRLSADRLAVLLKGSKGASKRNLPA